MKVEQEKEIFVPLVITLETQEELDEMFAVFNYEPINRCLNDLKNLYNELLTYQTDGYQDTHRKLQSNVT